MLIKTKWKILMTYWHAVIGYSTCFYIYFVLFKILTQFLSFYKPKWDFKMTKQKVKVGIPSIILSYHEQVRHFSIALWETISGVKTSKVSLIKYNYLLLLNPNMIKTRTDTPRRHDCHTPFLEQSRLIITSFNTMKTNYKLNSFLCFAIDRLHCRISPFCEK